MPSFVDQLAFLDAQRDAMLELVTRFAQVNSATHNLTGIEALSKLVEDEFRSLGGQITHHPLAPAESIDSSANLIQSPLADAIRIVKRPDAPLRVLLVIHLDTVYPPDHPFQTVTRIDAHTLRGPGVADAKGGLVVMLYALRALEQSEIASTIGWEVVLNTDEEIGSAGSAPLLIDSAKRAHAALVFEPALPDGSLVGARKGSGNFTVVVRGRAAHAGRDFHLGRSAILALAEFIARFDAAQHDLPGVTINCGRIEGGGALNVVPDLAIGRFNVRVTRAPEMDTIQQRINELAEQIRQRDGISLSIHGGFHSPPKPMDPRSAKLFESIEACGKELGLDLAIHSSGGACDGNRLAAAGLGVIDTLGPRGGHLHSPQEYLLIDSLPERAKLAALLLLRLASGQVI